MRATSIIDAIVPVPMREYVGIVMDRGKRECLVPRAALKSRSSLAVAVRLNGGHVVELPPTEEFAAWLDLMLRAGHSLSAGRAAAG